MIYTYSSIIENKILSYLEGWKTVVLSSGSELTNEISSFLSDEEIENLNVVKKITSEELELFFTKASLQVTSYLGITLENIPSEEYEVILEGICQWTAGLLWKKYNVKPVENVDETPFTGYGDDLLYKAKKQLQPYRYRKMIIL